MKTPIPKRLSEARERNGISQRQLGIKAGIDEFAASPRINQYERGVHTPDFTMVSNLAKVLRTPVPYFYAEDNKMAEFILLFSKLASKDKEIILSNIKSLRTD